MSLLSAGCSGTFRYVRRQQSSFYSKFSCVQINITLKICVLMYIQELLSSHGDYIFFFYPQVCQYGKWVYTFESMWHILANASNLQLYIYIYIIYTGATGKWTTYLLNHGVTVGYTVNMDPDAHYHIWKITTTCLSSHVRSTTDF
jgi:hypothetical protein